MKIVRVLVSLLIAMPSAAAPTQQPAKSSQKTRTISRPVGASIRSLLQPSDEIVVIRDGVPAPPLEVAFSSQQERERYEWELLSRPGNSLLRVRVESLTSALDSTESWITSTATLRILEVLASGDQLRDGNWGDMTIDTKGHSITLNFDGGEVRLGKTLVSAGDYSIWEQGAEYLISFRVVPDERATHIGLVYKASANGILSAPQRSRGSSMSNPKGLNGRQLADVRKSIGRPAK
jgi:hypothetical protein